MTRRDHAYIGARPTESGYVGRCRCGWSCPEKLTKRSAQEAVVAHIGAVRAVEAAPS